MIRIYCIACMLFVSLWAGILHDRTDLEGEDERGARISSHVTLVSDIAYGKHPKERFDVYTPQHTTLSFFTRDFYGTRRRVDDRR